MKKILFAIWAMLFTLNSSGQTVMDAAKEINTIKADTSYIYAESTVKDWETAYENAKLLLSKEIEDWLVANGVKDISGVITTSSEHIMEIKTTRGSLYRAFVYVNKNKLLPFTDKSKVVVVDMGHEERPNNNNQSISLTPIEREMLNVDKFDKIEGFILKKKNEGVVSKYGKYANIPNSGIIYIFVYNRQGEVPACLKRENEVTTNLSNGKIETINEQYKGCGAIWFKLKK